MVAAEGSAALPACAGSGWAAEHFQLVPRKDRVLSDHSGHTFDVTLTESRFESLVHLPDRLFLYKGRC